MFTQRKSNASEREIPLVGCGGEPAVKSAARADRLTQKLTPQGFAMSKGGTSRSVACCRKCLHFPFYSWIPGWVA
jgi:hypothetical protein